MTLTSTGLLERSCVRSCFSPLTTYGARITGPTEHVVAIVRALELTDPSPSTILLADWGSRMGQKLFYPPNVGGWTGGRSWMNSRSIIARANFGAALASGELWRSRDS